MATMADRHPADGAYISFLHLPYEIREQIYLDVLALHPRVERELPGYPARQIARYVTAPITPPPSQSPSPSRASSSSTYKPIPSSRPLGYIPHALLATCRHIYHEARLLPFERNEFVFTHWMTSATSYCEAVLATMKPWQHEAIRHVRFAMGLEELSDRASTNVYICRMSRICELLPGLRTVRMNLSCGVFPTDWFEKDVDTGEVRVREDWKSGGRRWLDEGLGKLRGLRTVEIECSFLVWMTSSGGMASEEKRSVDGGLAVEWCQRVEGIVNEGRKLEEGEEGRTRVVAVRIVRDGCGRGGALSEADELTLAYMPSGLGVEFSSFV